MKVNMLKLACLLALVTFISAQFSHQHEHAEHSTLGFFYDPTSHYLVGRTRSSCYFLSLSDDDLSTIHTPDGLELAEMKMITMIRGGEDELSSEDFVKHRHLIDIMCHSHTLYRVGSKATTVVTYPAGRTTTPTPKALPTTTPARDQ